MPRAQTKATNILADKGYLAHRLRGLERAGYRKTKWIEFCEQMHELGLQPWLYEARRTFSKYITVKKKGHEPFKVRFSNHRPIKSREDAGDCDFFVGVANNRTTTTEQAIEAVKRHFNLCKEVCDA